MKKKFFSMAIDGPSGAGKSTLAKAAAKEFGFLYMDTGAIYRTVGLAAFKAGIPSRDRQGVVALLDELSIELRHDSGGDQRMYLYGEDVSGEIRMPEISIYASDVSAMPEVRAYLLEMQRDMARRHHIIMDGRDIGTVVLPDADLKIFLSASAEERAKRRLADLEADGIAASYEQVLRDIRYRDENDSQRAAAPLMAAPDAVFLDTTENSLEESIELICSMIRRKLVS